MSTVTTLERPPGNGTLGAPRSVIRVVVLVALFSIAPLFEAAHISAIFSGEIGLHLRTGFWILQNHSVPRTGLFSQYSELPWITSSWGYEVLLAAAYKLLGLRALPILLMGLKAMLAVLLFLLARAGHADFWTAVALAAVAQYVISGLLPDPSTISILFFAIELQLLVRSREAGTVRSLYWLPPLFVLWANLHLQFISGLLLLGLFLISVCIEYVLRGAGVDWISNRTLPLPLARVGAIAGVSVLGTFVTPYFFRPFLVALGALYSDVGFEYFAEMRAMSFRRPQEFALMLLVMAAFFVLGRKRSLALFELCALTAGAAVAFRVQRDLWMAVLPAIAVLGRGCHTEDNDSKYPAASFPREKFTSVVVAWSILAFAALRLPDEHALMDKISHAFPVKACDLIVQNQLPQPLFNAFSWGDFLIWYMPQYPVLVDSRVELYGDEILTRYFKLTFGKERLDTDAGFARARTLLLERQSGMAKALTNLPALNSQYRLVYSDDLADVFVRQ